MQITVWDYVLDDRKDFLGMVVLDIANHPLDDEAEWYTLRTQADAHQGLNVSVTNRHHNTRISMPVKRHTKTTANTHKFKNIGVYSVPLSDVSTNQLYSNL